MWRTKRCLNANEWKCSHPALLSSHEKVYFNTILVLSHQIRVLLLFLNTQTDAFKPPIQGRSSDERKSSGDKDLFKSFLVFLYI
jgi:hypothetical protein